MSLDLAGKVIQFKDVAINPAKSFQLSINQSGV
jgi:hypothetical protein